MMMESLDGSAGDHKLRCFPPSACVKATMIRESGGLRRAGRAAAAPAGVREERETGGKQDPAPS